MADNVTVTAGTGTTVAADEVTDATLGVVKVQYVKIMDGTLDGTTKGVVNSNGLKVDASGATVPVSGTFFQGTQPVSGTVTVTNFGAALTRAAGAVDANTQRVTIDSTQVGTTGQTTMSASVPVVIANNQTAVPVTSTPATLGQAAMAASAPVVIANNQSSVPVTPASTWVYNTGYYVTAAASATTTLQSSTGAIGDYLDHVVVFPGTTAAGSVAVIDNATTLVTWPGGGTTALLTLTPFTIYVGAVSRSGTWKLTLGTNVTAIAIGRFS